MLLNGIGGFCVAMTDSIPGVSRGTIVFLLEFYDEFIDLLNGLMGKGNTRRKQAFIFLSKLGIEWILGFCLPVLVLSGLFQDYIYRTSSVFMGPTLSAVPMVIREERRPMKGRYDNLTFTFAEMALMFCIPYFNPVGEQGISVSVEHLSLGLVVHVFITAIVTITAIVLLGTSGFTLSLIFGIYAPVIGAIRELLRMNLNYVPTLTVFGLGVVIGIVGIIKLIKLCLEHYCSQAIYTVTGLTMGLLHAITVRPTALDVPRDSIGLNTSRTLFFLLGSLILVGLGSMKTRLEKQ